VRSLDFRITGQAGSLSDLSIAGTACTITVANSGPDPASGVQVTDLLSSQAAFGGASQRRLHHRRRYGHAGGILSAPGAIIRRLHVDDTRRLALSSR